MVWEMECRWSCAALSRRNVGQVVIMSRWVVMLSLKSQLQSLLKKGLLARRLIHTLS